MTKTRNPTPSEALKLLTEAERACSIARSCLEQRGTEDMLRLVADEQLGVVERALTRITGYAAPRRSPEKAATPATSMADVERSLQAEFDATGSLDAKRRLVQYQDFRRDHGSSGVDFTGCDSAAEAKRRIAAAKK